MAGLLFNIHVMPWVPNICQPVVNVANAYPEKPIACWIYAPDEGRQATAKCEENGNTVVFDTVDRGIRALARLADYWEFLHSEG